MKLSEKGQLQFGFVLAVGDPPKWRQCRLPGYEAQVPRALLQVTFAGLQGRCKERPGWPP